MSTHWPMVYLLKKEGSYYPAIDDNSKSNLWTGFGAILWRRISKGVCNVGCNAMEKNGKQQKVYSDEFVHVDCEGDPPALITRITHQISMLMVKAEMCEPYNFQSLWASLIVQNVQASKVGVINFTYIRGIKQYKCIVILSDLPIIIMQLFWVGNTMEPPDIVVFVSADANPPKKKSTHPFAQQTVGSWRTPRGN